MGREIRMVPANWQHPKMGEHRANRNSIYYVHAQESRVDNDAYIPLYDQTYEAASKEWIEGFINWHVQGKKESKISENYWEYAGNLPDEGFYRTYKDEDATWYQLYENVSEGTPVSPPFETKDELIDYLCTKVDFWQQSAPAKWGGPFTPYSRKAAEYLVNGGYAPSLVITRDGNGVIRESGAEAFAKTQT